MYYIIFIFIFIIINKFTKDFLMEFFQKNKINEIKT
jgi:hypothetical protein